MATRLRVILILAAATLALCGAYASGQSTYSLLPSAVTTIVHRTSEGTAAVTVTRTQETPHTTLAQGTAVTYEGTLRLAYVDSGPDIPAEPVAYLEREGRNYRLLGVDFLTFVDGTSVRVIGTLATPSSWNRPYPLFDGDILVQHITAL
jgi:hypothetical protein